MPKRSSKTATPPKIKQDAVDESRATAEGMGQPQDQDPPKPAKNPAAVALGKLGGEKGGPARAKKLSKARRSEIAKKAAQARWKKKKR
jgi:hypothetical protein